MSTWAPYATFVSRQQELGQLSRYLEQTLVGEGRICFIAGDAGSGKSTLVREFCRQSQEKYHDLIVAFGQNSAETGISDPNLVFREILSQLTGDLESESNALGTVFRKALYTQTGGNPLFIVELLRDLQERGIIEKDDRIQWVENGGLNWDTLPAKIEGVVQGRIGRLDDEVSEPLSICKCGR